MKTIQTDINEHPVSMYINGIESVNGKASAMHALRRALAVSAGIEVSEIDIQAVYEFGYPTITSDKVLALKTALLERYSNSTASQTISALKGVMGACFDMGMIDGDTLKRIERVKSVKVKSDVTVGRYIEDWELDKLKEVLAQDDTARGLRDSAIIAFMWEQALRVSDITSANIEDWSGKSGRLVIPKGKGGKPGEVKLANGALDCARAWVRERGRFPGALFCRIDNAGKIVKDGKNLSRHAISKMLDKRRLQAGLEPLSAHDFRRSCLTYLTETIGIRQAQIVARHSSIQTTARYLRDSKDKALNASAQAGRW